MVLSGLRFHSVARPALAGGLCALCLALGACSTSPRNDFYASRSIVLRGQPGDGSRVATAYPAPADLRTARAEARR
ncbi:MAG: hypothetical protein RBS39_03065 [Phycisphaerales bacterium]|jgi:hypothetical protein|nr:hypothetical protein [Phycisphaerales bacterium]